MHDSACVFLSRSNGTWPVDVSQNCLKALMLLKPSGLQAFVSDGEVMQRIIATEMEFAF